MVSTGIKCKVKVESDKGKLRLRFTYAGKRLTPYLKLTDDADNWKTAESIAWKIHRDLENGSFDETLERYGLNKKRHLAIAETSKPLQSFTCDELWQKYFDFKKSGLKVKTLEKYTNLGRLYNKVGKVGVLDALEVKKKLESITTVDRTRDALMYLNACCKWALKHGLISFNPYDGMYNEMPKPNYMTDPQPNAFSPKERDQIIEAFLNDNRKGMNYRQYAPLVQFLFAVGCRPSEAIGLQWKNVSEDCRIIHFESSIVQVGNKRIRSKGSKNNKTRDLAVSPKIRDLLQSIKPESVNPDSLVFPGHKNEPINYRNFCRRAWSSIVDPIKPDTTPYSCRDTFITHQILSGVPESTIADWCDTSIEMIQKYYADKLKLRQITPVDY